MGQIVNKREIRVIGMSRSGNHAVINWIRRQAQGRTCYLNCTEPGTNPFWTARPLDHGFPFEANYTGFVLDRERLGRFTRKDYLIFSHEDVLLGMVAGGLFERHHDEWVGSSASRTDVLILRDPFNLFASRFRLASRAHLEFNIRPSAMRIWKQHAREFLGERRKLTNPTVCISYNRWVQSKSYRQHLARELGLEFSDAGIREVPRCAGGSSFDGRRFHGRAARMKVLSRWRAFAKDPAYRQLFDPEVFRLSQEIFGSDSELQWSGLRKLLAGSLPNRSRQAINGVLAPPRPQAR